MMAHGNGDVVACVRNLIRTPKGSVPMEQFKGIDPAFVDSPATDSAGARIAVSEVISQYEPRARARDVVVESAGADGSVGIRVSVAGEVL